MQTERRTLQQQIENLQAELATRLEQSERMQQIISELRQRFISLYA